MDVRKFFNIGGAKPPTTTSTTTNSTTTSSTRPVANKPTNSALFDDSDDDVVVVSKSRAANSVVKLAPPTTKVPPKTPPRDSGGPQKSNRENNKRKKVDSSYSEDSSSSSSSSSNSSSDSSSGSDSFFGESDFASDNDGKDKKSKSKGPQKSDRTLNKRSSAKSPSKPTRGHTTKMGDDTSDDDAPASTKKKAAAKTDKDKSPAKPKKVPTPNNPGVTQSDWDYADIALPNVQKLEPASKFVIDPTTGKSAPIWTVTVAAKPPQYKGMRSRPIGRSDSFATGGGGPNAKNRSGPMTFVITGVLKSLEREECEDLIKSMGGKVTGSPSGRTDFLILGEEPGPSKVNKALDAGTYIIDEDGFFRLIIKKNPRLSQPAGLMLDEVDDVRGGIPGPIGSNAQASAHQQIVNSPPASQSMSTTMNDEPTTTTTTTARSIATPAPDLIVAPTAPAAKKGSLYARKAATTTPSTSEETTTTTTTTANTTSLISTPSQTSMFDSNLSSTQTITQTQSLPTDSSLNSLPMSDNSTITPKATPKPSLYARKSTSTSTSMTPNQSSSLPSLPSSIQSGISQNGIVDPNIKLGQHRIESYDTTNLPKVNTYPGTTENDLWVDRFKPNTVEDICGNNNMVKDIVHWLKNWDYYYKHEQFQGMAKAKKTQPGEELCRAILLAGGPGIGKTTAAMLCAKAAGLTTIEFNASDTRNQNSIRAQVGVLSDNKTLNSFFGKTSNSTSTTTTTTTSITKPSPHTGTGSVIIMDEVDGVSASDRGGMAELLKIIKNTSAPIICICNDARSDKVKSLKNYCRSYTWQRPRSTQVAKRLQLIAASQGLKIDDRAIEEIYKNTNSDLRATINYLQMLATTRRGTVVSYEDSKVQKSANVKDIETGPFDVLGTFFSSQTGTSWFSNAVNNVNIAQDLLPMYMFENYARARPNSNFGRVSTHIGAPPVVIAPKQSYQPKLLNQKSFIPTLNNNQKATKPFIADFSTVLIPPQPPAPGQRYIPPPQPASSGPNDTKTQLRVLAVANCALDAMSLSTELETAMMDEGAFFLWPVQGALGVIYPGQAMGSGLTGMIQFPSLLGKISSMNKAIRVGTLLRTYFAIMTTPLSKKELMLNYLPSFHQKFIALMLGRIALTASDIRHVYGEQYCQLFKADKYTSGLECAAQLLTWLNMTKDDFDILVESIDTMIVNANDSLPPSGQPQPQYKNNAIGRVMMNLRKLDTKSTPTYSNIESKTKANLTRLLTKLSNFKGKRSGGGKGVNAADKASNAPLTEEQQLELAEHELALTDDDEDGGDAQKDDEDVPSSIVIIKQVGAKAGSAAVKRQKRN